jgi:PAS domain S-box-containing protein
LFRTLAHASLAMQTAFSCLLVCLLEFYYRRVAGEAWLRWFGFSWVAQAAYMASLWVVFDNPSGGSFLRAATSLLGFVVPATFALTSVALLRRRTPTRTWIAGVYLAAIVAAAIRFVAGLPYPIAGVQASRIHNVPTYAVYGLTSLLAAVAFTRHGRQQRLAGSLVTAGAWALYGLFNLIRAGLWYKTTTWALYGAENNPALLQFSLLTFITNSTVWIVMSIGVGLLLTESAERSERRARGALRELQQAQTERGRLAQLVEQSHDAILVIAEGQLRYLNTAAAHILGYAVDEIPSLFMKPLEEVCGIVEEDPMREQMDGTLAVAGVWEGQSEWRNRLTGERTPMLVGAVAMDAREGEPPSTGLIGRDLRERVRLEEELRQKLRLENHDLLASLRVSKNRAEALAVALLTAEDEKHRKVSRELHDGLNQTIAILLIDAELLERQPPSSSDQNAAQLRSLRSHITELSDDLRRIVHQLHPAALEQLGLVAALESFCAEFSDCEKVLVRFRQRHVPGSIPPDIALCLYRVVQEGLRNIVNHSRSRSAAIVLSGSARCICLSVRDFGVGFQPEVRDIKGLGLLNMEERARLVGGSFSVHSRLGKGTRIEVLVPLGERASCDRM